MSAILRYGGGEDVSVGTSNSSIMSGLGDRISTFLLEVFVKRIRDGGDRGPRFGFARTRTVMRRNACFRIVCALSVVMWPFSNAAQAQDAPSSRPVEIGIMAGGVGVTGQFRGKMSSGLAGGVTLQLPLSPRWLALRADLQYAAISNRPIGCPDFRGNCDYGPSEIASGSLGVVARLNAAEARWSPYVVAGVAAYHVGHFISPEVGTIHTNPLGWQGGLGIEVRSRKRTFFAEMRYMTIAPGGVFPVVVGMRF